MEKLISSLYDLIAYFVPGAVVFSAVGFLFVETNVQILKTENLPDFALGAIILAIIYTLGHILHAIANNTIDRLPSGGYPPRDYFPRQFERDFGEQFRMALYSHINKTFQLQKPGRADKARVLDSAAVIQTVKDAYWPCYIIVEESRADTLVQRFSSITGLYRGLTVGSFIVAIIYLVAAWYLKNIAWVWVTVATTVIGLLFLQRNNRFKHYLTNIVYSSFLHSVDGSQKQDNS